MDPRPEDIAAALAGNKTVAEPGAAATGHLWHEYWKEVGRWAPWLGMAIPSPSGVGAMSAMTRPIAGPLTSAANPNPMQLDSITQMLRAQTGKMPTNTNFPRSGLQEEASGQAIYAPSTAELAARGPQSASNPLPLETTQNIRPPANTNWTYPDEPAPLTPLQQKILEYLRSKVNQSATDAELMRHLGIRPTPKVVPPDEGGTPPTTP